MTEAETREVLFKVHKIKMAAHWGHKYAEQNAHKNWPSTDKEWRQTSHGAPWDTNVEMAKFHLALAKDLQKEGLLE